MKNVDTLAKDHADYVAAVLSCHAVDSATIEIVLFHYIEAFKHGFKHGVEDTNGQKQILI